MKQSNKLLFSLIEESSEFMNECKLNISILTTSFIISIKDIPRTCDGMCENKILFCALTEFVRSMRHWNVSGFYWSLS